MRLNLEKWLRLRGVTPAQLAKGIGVSGPSVYAWLNGRVRKGVRVDVFPDHEQLEKICKFLECQPNDLLIMDDKPADKTWRDFLPTAAA